MRVIKYKTKLDDTRKAVLEKEISVNCPDVDRKINSPDKIVRLAKYFLHMHEESEEYMYMICMDNKLHMTCLFEISHGTVNSSIVGTREVYQKALLANAVSIAFIHNHPSGDPKPSREDIEITKRLVEAGKIIGIQVLDHIIIGHPECVSLKEKGHM